MSNDSAAAQLATATPGELTRAGLPVPPGWALTTEAYRQVATGLETNGDGLAELRSYLDGFWEEALAAFKEAAESDPKGAGDEPRDD
jgi:phosphoenolpyruvate synthase/pyruvate phosphate dikinase